ncbi:MAG: hypothetical protein WDO19_24835 [Bacteroidota bacterium]
MRDSKMGKSMIPKTFGEKGWQTYLCRPEKSGWINSSPGSYRDS